MIFDLLTDLNAGIYIPEVIQVDLPFGSMIDIGRAYLSREVETTMSLDEIKRMSMENPVVEEFLRKMIALQQHEYEEATTFEPLNISTGSGITFQ